MIDSIDNDKLRILEGEEDDQHTGSKSWSQYMRGGIKQPIYPIRIPKAFIYPPLPDLRFSSGRHE